MAQTNLTDDENQKPLRELWCSAEFIRGVDCELIFLSRCKYISFHHCISGEHSDPSCPSQGNFTSSAVQTPVS